MVSSISLRNKYSNLWSKIYPTINVDAHSFYLIHVLEVTKLFIFFLFFFLDKNYFFRILLVLSQVHQLHFVWCNLNPVCKQGNAPEWYWGSILNRSLFFFKKLYVVLCTYTQIKYGFLLLEYNLPLTFRSKGT